MRIAALIRPPDEAAGEDPERWLERAREAAAHGPLGHHTHWGGPAQARIARLLRASVTSIPPLDKRLALRIGARCAVTGVADVVDVSVALCARDRGHAVVTSDPQDIHAVEPSLTLLSPT